ncbi:TonB-dependent receptor [Rhodocaloribacter litoris]|uniref:SusC/RagA family TonB-linked outer membrane protein n=1 Tax=Rhodocaloribacter litoris TaxID=2558931 RepID=UPI001E420267|nr:TonB-dependent receptor [Rhodocaloribacter litoris]QXD14803.1 TonB-dependent receptor [Rhodocaloribacter litoris]
MARLLVCLLLAGSLVQRVLAQEHTVRGRVMSSEQGEALPGTNVTVKGTTIGTATDIAGRYELTIPSPQDTLVFSFVGYRLVEVPVEGRTVIDVVLEPQVFTGAELVVVGYGAQERRDITGAIVSVPTREIQELPVIDAGQVLQGRTTGVVALAAGNRPGEGVTLRIRGRRSLTASNDPLFVVDGIPLEGGLNDISTQDIESIEVLKDASATAIYGSRGANGVVLITTNRGGNHPTRVTYAAYAGATEALGRPDMMNAREFADLRREASRDPLTGEIPPDEEIFTQAELDALARGISTDYQDLLLERGYRMNHHLGVEGGNATTRFYLAGDYFDERGIIRSQGFERYTFRVNLDHDVSSRFRLGTAAQISRQVQQYASNPLGSAVAMNPLSVPYDENGNLIFRPGADPLLFNPLADLEPGNYLDERTRTRVFGNLFAELDLTQSLRYRVNFGPDVQKYRRGLFQGSISVARQEGSPLARYETDDIFAYTLENIITYEHILAPDHALDVTGLFGIQSYRRESSWLEGTGLPYETQLFYNLGTSENLQDFGSTLAEWGLMSFMGRVNYQFKDRYLLTLTGRYDGASVLAEGNKWGFFPSVGLGWVVSDEPFMAGQGLFSELKLRLSYGQTGNQAIAPYQTRGALCRTNYLFGDEAAFGFRPCAIANPDLKWETSTTVNLGLDFSLWDDRIAGSIDLYQTRTTDLLLERQLPITSGFASVTTNLGETRNRGYELNLRTLNVETAVFSWSTDLTLFGNEEKILDLYGTGEDDVGNGWFIGHPLTVWYDYEKVGIWQLDEAEEAASYGQRPGEIKVRDVNRDGVINEEDRVILGTDLPRISGGITNRFRYRNFDFSFFLFGSFGHTIFNDFKVQNSTLASRFNNLDLDYWTPDNPTNEAPRPNRTQENPIYGSTRGYQPGDFLKVRNVQLGYTLPEAFLSRFGMQYMRVYVSANSPLVFSRLEGGLDPEMYGGRVEDDNVPAPRLYTLGLNVTF